uniref:hypothetical protein n=1 Tax=Akkermansia muciniphila TaxID=239935 RepID=UPI00402853C2
MSRRATTKKKATRQVPAEPESAGESPDQTPATPDELRESDDEPSSTPDKKSVRVIRTRAELDGGLVISLSMKTDTPELPAPVAEALQTLNLVDIK